MEERAFDAETSADVPFADPSARDHSRLSSHLIDLNDAPMAESGEWRFSWGSIDGANGDGGYRHDSTGQDFADQDAGEHEVADHEDVESEAAEHETAANGFTANGYPTNGWATGGYVRNGITGSELWGGESQDDQTQDREPQDGEPQDAAPSWGSDRSDPARVVGRASVSSPITPVDPPALIEETGTEAPWHTPSDQRWTGAADQPWNAAAADAAPYASWADPPAAEPAPRPWTATPDAPAAQSWTATPDAPVARSWTATPDEPTAPPWAAAADEAADQPWAGSANRPEEDAQASWAFAPADQPEADAHSWSEPVEDDRPDSAWRSAGRELPPWLADLKSFDEAIQSGQIPDTAADSAAPSGGTWLFETFGQESASDLEAVTPDETAPADLDPIDAGSAEPAAPDWFDRFGADSQDAARASAYTFTEPAPFEAEPAAEPESFAEPAPFAGSEPPATERPFDTGRTSAVVGRASVPFPRIPTPRPAEPLAGEPLTSDPLTSDPLTPEPPLADPTAAAGVPPALDVPPQPRVRAVARVPGPRDAAPAIDEPRPPTPPEPPSPPEPPTPPEPHDPEPLDPQPEPSPEPEPLPSPEPAPTPPPPVPVPHPPAPEPAPFPPIPVPEPYPQPEPFPQPGPFPTPPGPPPGPFPAPPFPPTPPTMDVSARQVASDEDLDRPFVVPQAVGLGGDRLDRFALPKLGNPVDAAARLAALDADDDRAAAPVAAVEEVGPVVARASVPVRPQPSTPTPPTDGVAYAAEDWRAGIRGAPARPEGRVYRDAYDASSPMTTSIPRTPAVTPATAAKPEPDEDDDGEEIVSPLDRFARVAVLVFFAVVFVVLFLWGPQISQWWSSL